MATTSLMATWDVTWAGSGLSLRFDFIIIHESAHEWFGNSVTRRRPVRHVDS